MVRYVRYFLMRILTSKHFGIRYGLSALLTASTVFILCLVYYTRIETIDPFDLEDGAMFYQPKPFFDIRSHQILLDEFLQCKAYQANFSSMNETWNSEVPLTSLTSDKNNVTETESIFHMAEAFNQVISSFNIKMAIIEPSFLFCLLPSAQREKLFRRKLNFKSFSRDDSLITFAILAKDANELEKFDVQENFRNAGFNPKFIKVPVREWMETENVHTLTSTHFVSHIFYQYKRFTAHMVVFYQRRNYLWHASLPSPLTRNLPDSKAQVPFIHHDSAYDTFQFFPVNLERVFGSKFSFNVPSNPHVFLMHMESSRFLECNQTIVDEFRKTERSDSTEEHPSLSVEEFNKRAITALRELKLIMNELLMNWWIWSGTMLGWHRQCSIIPYTSDVDTGAWAEELDDFDVLHNLFNESKIFKIRERYGVVETGLEFNLNCHGMRLDIFFHYPEENGTWYAGHRPSRGYYFKYHHPSFTLCSADLLGERVPVPCDAEKNIVAEYGTDWMKPVSSWNYETSIKNRGPNIYWSKEILPNTYKGY